MTPETGLFLAKAQRLLVEAEGMFSLHYNDAAGRTAYLAGYNAAQALISEQTGRSAKTHKDVNTEFHRLVRGDTHFDDDRLRNFLGLTYNLKAIADYETGPGSEVSPEQATQAIHEAKRFVATIAAVLKGS